MKHFKRTTTLLSIAITATLLTACGGGSSDNNDGTGTGTGTGTQTPTTYWKYTKYVKSVAAGSTPSQFDAVTVEQYLSPFTFPEANYGVSSTARREPGAGGELLIKQFEDYDFNSDGFEYIVTYTLNNDQNLPVNYQYFDEGDFAKISYSLNSAGQMTQQQYRDESGNVTRTLSYTLDSEGRVTRYEDENSSGAITFASIHEYSDLPNNGWQRKQTAYYGDPATVPAYDINTFQYDSSDHLIKQIVEATRTGVTSYVVTDYTINPTNGQTESDSYTYTSADATHIADKQVRYEETTDSNTGNKTLKKIMTNLVTNTTSAHYTITDSNGNVLEKSLDTDNDGTKDRYYEINTYDANGNRLTGARDIDGDGNYDRITVRTHDAQNRIITSSYYSDTADSGALNNGGYSSQTIHTYNEFTFSDSEPSCADIFANVLAQTPQNCLAITPEQAKTDYDNAQPQPQPQP